MKSQGYENLKKHPVIIVGYSDTTALLMAVHAKTGLENPGTRKRKVRKPLEWNDKQKRIIEDDWEDG